MSKCILTNIFANFTISVFYFGNFLPNYIVAILQPKNLTIINAENY